MTEARHKSTLRALWDEIAHIGPGVTPTPSERLALGAVVVAARRPPRARAAAAAAIIARSLETDESRRVTWSGIIVLALLLAEGVGR